MFDPNAVGTPFNAAVPGRFTPSTATAVDGVLVDASDFNTVRSVLGVGFTDELRGGGKSPFVDDTTVTVRFTSPRSKR